MPDVHVGARRVWVHVDLLARYAFTANVFDTQVTGPAYTILRATTQARRRSKPRIHLSTCLPERQKTC